MAENLASTDTLTRSNSRGRARVEHALRHYATTHRKIMLDPRNSRHGKVRATYAALLALTRIPDRDEATITKGARRMLIDSGVSAGETDRWLRLTDAER